jgi:hypothetical protein
METGAHGQLLPRAVLHAEQGIRSERESVTTLPQVMEEEFALGTLW